MFGDSVLNAARNPMSPFRRLFPRWIAGVGVLLLALVLAVTGQASVVPASAAAHSPVVSAATGGTGTGGAFNPLSTRLVDTRNGTGGFSTPLPAGTWRAYTAAGVGGIPATGVSSLVVTVTVIDPAGGGSVSLAPNTSLPSSPVTFLLYDAGDRVSNSGVVDIGTDGKIAVRANTSVDVLIDVQGYFTAGNGTPAPGGYVSANNTRIVSSGQLAIGSTSTFTAVGGSTGIPTTATAIYANITVLTTSTTSNYVTPYATNSTRPATTLNFPGSPTTGVSDATALGATVDLNSSGQFSLYVGPTGGSVQVLIDVQGYFDGEPSTSGFTPLNARIFDSRSPSVVMAANSVTTVQVGGVGGIPAGSNSLAGVALNVQVIPGTSGGYLRLWSGDDAEPTSTSTLNFDTARASNLTLIQPAVTNGTIKIRNISNTAVTVVLDAEGYLTNPSVLPQAYGTNVTASGSRTAASMISHTSTDRSGVQINPTNGNLLYSQALLNVTGVGVSNSIGLRYNSLNDTRPTLNAGLFESQLYRNGSTGAITYTAPDGAGYVFNEVTGAGASYTDPVNYPGVTFYTYVTPNGINASLVRRGSTYGPGTEYDLTMHPGQSMNVYADNGSNITLNSTQDVTGANKISYTYAKGALTTITDTQGRTVTFGYASGNNTTQPSTITDNSLGRTINLTYSAASTPANGAVTKIVDATGAQTLFAYNTAGKLSSVTDGRGDVTAFTYGAGNKLATMTAASTIGSGVPPTTSSTWTFAYLSSTSTTVADPNSKVDTYTFTSALQVTKITDARGHAQSKGYNSHNDTTSSSSAYNDTTSYDTATSTYNLMKITSPSATRGGGGAVGRAQSFTYTTAPSGPGGTYNTADFRPTTVTDTNTNMSTYAYNNFGEPKSVQSAGGAAGTTLLKYQDDNQVTPATSCGGKTGQLCTSTDGKGNVTSYSYNSAGNLTTMTPPAPLGAHTFVYDAAGRKVSETDGRGNTAYTCYDLNDRTTQVSYTTAACATVSGVTYTYDQAGNQTSRVTAATGTTVTWTYDAQNRPTAQADSAGSSSTTYDPANNVLTFTDNGGATTYTYDDTNNVATLAEPGGNCPAGTITPNTTKCVLFSYDDNNKRLTTALPNGVTNTVTYDTSSRTTSVKAVKATSTSVNRSYAYDNTGTDSGVIRTMTNAVASTTTSYTYDQVNRLAGDTVKDAGGYTVGTDSYLYDLNGNITKQVTGGTTKYYGYNAADQMCWTANTTGTGCTTPTYGTAYTYDGNGNTLTGDTSTGTNTWTNYNQQATTTVGGAQSYTYAGTTNTQRTAAGGVTFTNSLLGQVSSQAGGVPNNEYIRDPDGTLIALQTGGNSYYYTLDNISSVLLLTDNTGTAAATYTYNPYGKTLTATGAVATQNPYRYASGYTDNTGLIKYGARYYNPTLARFTQPDPSGQETNNYAYAGNNPIITTDPTGLCSWFAIYCPDPLDSQPDYSSKQLAGCVGTAGGTYLAGQGLLSALGAGAAAGSEFGPVGATAGAFVFGLFTIYSRC